LAETPLLPKITRSVNEIHPRDCSEIQKTLYLWVLGGTVNDGWHGQAVLGRGDQERCFAYIKSQKRWIMAGIMCNET